jgi:Fe-S cluster biogenesis protein NfuA/nitrite reductase/ring-hydroxylating ferredoxin subunit
MASARIDATAGGDAPQLLLDRVQELEERLAREGDPRTRELADELISSVVELYGAGLERILGRLRELTADGERLALALGEDPLVATLLLIHDLHPVPLEQRVREALDSVRPYMESHGGSVELLAVEEGVARIHLRGSCSDCSASSVTLELAIKQALEQRAPDLAGLEVEGLAPRVEGVPLPMAGGAAAPPAPVWHELEGFSEPSAGEMLALEVGGRRLVIANVEGTLLAYHDSCGGCGAPLRAGELSGGALRCPACGRSFYLPRAGRSLDDDGLQLQPVPLLREGYRVMVALGG